MDLKSLLPKKKLSRVKAVKVVGAALAVRAKGVAAASDLSHVEDDRLLRLRKELSSLSMGEV